ncbi:MAG TPA: glycosyltransferase family 87 protein [Trichormus sp.]|jgi:hypothetical protein
MRLSTQNQNRITVAYWAFLFFWAANAYSLIGTYFVDNQILALNIQGRPYVNDFVVNYMAGKMSLICNQSHISIYDPDLERKYIDEIIAPVKQEATFYAEYPPTFFLVNTPLALLDARTAYLVYCGICLILILTSLYILSKAPGFTVLNWVAFVTAVLSSFPAWQNVRLGQALLIFFPLAVLCFWSLERKRYVLAGLLAGLLTIKGQYLPAIGLIGLFVGGYRYFFSALLSVAIAVVVSGLHLGWDNVMAYPHALLVVADSNQGVVGAAPEHMENLRGLLVQLTGQDGHAVHLTYWIVFLLTLCLIVYLWAFAYKRVKQSPFAFRAYASLTIVLTLLSSPHSHGPDYIFLALPAVWLWQMPLPEQESKRRLKKILILLLPALSWVCFFLTLIPFWHVPPFLLIGLATVWYIATQILPALSKTVAASGEQTQIESVES